MISPRHALLGLAFLSSTAAWSAPPRQDAPAREGEWLSYAKRSAVGWQVWGFEESRGSTEPVTELSEFGAIRLVG